MLSSLRSIHWTPSRRRDVKGEGFCIGASNRPTGPFVVLPNNQAKESLVHLCNSLIVKYSPNDFEWTSLQFNRNTVSMPHTDKNNRGTSLLVLAGDYTGGTFSLSDGSMKLDRPGQGLFFDGTCLHESAAFQGERFSVIAFFHSGFLQLDEAAQHRIPVSYTHLPLPTTPYV